MKSSSQNLLYAMIALFAFFFLWDALVVSRYAPKTVRRPVPVDGKLFPSPVGSPALQPGQLPADPNAEIVLTTDREEVTLEAQGGRVVSWRVRERDHWIELVPEAIHRRFSPLETETGLTFRLTKLSDRSGTAAARLPNGLELTKTLTLEANPPFHQLDITLRNPTSAPVSWDLPIPWGSGLDKRLAGVLAKDSKERPVTPEMRAIGFSNGRVKSWRAGFLFDRQLDHPDPAPFLWAGVDNNHFMAVFLADEKAPFAGVRAVADRTYPPSLLLPFGGTLAAGQTWSTSLPLFVGAKVYSQLKVLDHHLDQAVNFGLFGFIAKGLLWTLTRFKNLTGNYGWAIMLLTLCLQLAVLPLTQRSLQHSARMRELQPQIKAIQEAYKSDPKRLQMETMNLYKKNGMKFMGMEGCFPVLLQLPLFFAFYSTLNVAYELRGAPWIGWIHDLSAHDPKYILPVLMGVGMFFQQRVSAVGMDPAQARMMTIMPLMFTFMFLRMPAGLVLYWVVNSTTTLVLQSVIRRVNPPAARASGGSG